jgi:hypothetical protein
MKVNNSKAKEKKTIGYLPSLIKTIYLGERATLLWLFD